MRLYCRDHPFLVGVAVLMAIAFLMTPFLFVLSGRRHVYGEMKIIPTYEHGIVFGAGVTEDGIPSAALRDRLSTAVSLHEEGIIDAILVSGDNSESNNHETDVMTEYLLEHGIPETAISVDSHGTRTYNTCKNAHSTYGIEKALLITQGFHLPRAVFLCNAVGIESAGASASKREYLFENVYKLREILAIYKSLLDIYILDPP